MDKRYYFQLHIILKSTIVILSLMLFQLQLEMRLKNMYFYGRKATWDIYYGFYENGEIFLKLDLKKVIMILTK